MKINKIILSGMILILIGGFLFISDIITPFIRPITYLFLMGSSKGKDILFFTLFGLFLILSQLHKIIAIKSKSNKFLLISIITATIIFTIAIILEVYLRMKLGIELNTIFVNIEPSFSTTSILHTHLIKSILGQSLMAFKPMIGSSINTGAGLYSYIDIFSIPIIILILLLFIAEVFSLQKRKTIILVLLSFFETILLIGCFDGGIMGTPGALGLFGCILIYVDEKQILLFKDELKNKKNPFKAFASYIKKYEFDGSNTKVKLKRYSPYMIGLFIIILRLTISVIGANPEFYEVDIVNPENNINLTDQYPIEYVEATDNKISYRMSPTLNEHYLTNKLSESLNNSCDYYTVSWNFYSYF